MFIFHPYGCSVVPTAFVKETFLSTLNYLHTFVKSVDYLFVNLSPDFLFCFIDLCLPLS